jgi:hypothetical protein
MSAGEEWVPFGVRRPGASAGLALRFLPPVVVWILVTYAALLLAGMWSYALLRIQSDYRTTLEDERNSLRNVAAVLVAQVGAMLDDGVGAAVAAVNEIDVREGIARASDAHLSVTLGNMLTGGAYVRSLFVATSDRYTRVGRSVAPEHEPGPPQWLLPAFSVRSGEGWVGNPTHRGAYTAAPGFRRAPLTP